MIVMDLEDGDELVSVAQVNDSDEIVMVTEKGQAIIFRFRNCEDPRKNMTPRSRSAGGVKGIKLVGDDKVIGMAPVTADGQLLVVSQGGYGKSTPLKNYPRHGRGGQGVRTFRVTDKTGPVAASRVVTDDEGQEVFIISAKAQVVRINLEDVRVTNSRYTQGVIVWRDREPDDYVASVACFTENDYSTGGNGESNEATSQEAATREAQIPTDALPGSGDTAVTYGEAEQAEDVDRNGEDTGAE